LFTHLIEWIKIPKEKQGILPPSGFCGVSQRHGRKPILAAVDGLAIGGGMEALVNCDMVICSPASVFCLPDVKVGLSLLGGTLPLLVRKIGRSRASDMIFTGRNISASEAREWGLIDRMVEEPVKEAIKIAEMIVGNSPDAVWASREGVLIALGEGGSFELGREWKEKFWPGLRDSEDLEEGLNAFLERRKPLWGRTNKL
jgi:enoyl-CoA hydratase/carnithine racemase